jgi:hypothetical protein
LTEAGCLSKFYTNSVQLHLVYCPVHEACFYVMLSREQVPVQGTGSYTLLQSNACMHQDKRKQHPGVVPVQIIN